MRRRLAILVLLASPLFAQHDEKLRAFERFAQEEMKAQQMPGLSVAILYGDFRWSSGFGYSDVENEVPAKPESSYRMASVTKPMTAVAILELAEQGRIDLDAEVQKYVPYFPRKAHPVTIRQLLAHQGGISHYRDYSKEGRIKEPKSTREAISLFADFDLVAEPGTRYSYTTYGYNLLGAVIEEVSGKPYGEFMTATVWRPLGMSSTIMDDPRAVVPHRVHGYVLENGRLRRSEYVDVSSRFAGGGTRSTVMDMIRFVEGIAAGKLLDRETVDRAWTAMPTRTQRRTTYGLGFGVYPRNGRWVVAHTGSQQETRTSLIYVPARRFAIALASNFENADLDPFEDRLVSLFLGDPPAVGARAERETDNEIWRAIAQSYESGLAYYDRHGKPLTTDPRELKNAFAYFRDAIRPDRKKVDEGAHPVSGEAFVIVGSHMAGVLAATTGGNLDRHHRDGALRFFVDYARAAKRHKLDRTFNARVEKWAREWSRAWTPELQALTLTSFDELDVLERHREVLTAATIRPDFSRQLIGLAESEARWGDIASAIRIASVGVSLYPRSPGLNGVLGIANVMAGNRDEGIAFLRTSQGIDPTGYASSENLKRIARSVPQEAAAVLVEFATSSPPPVTTGRGER